MYRCENTSRPNDPDARCAFKSSSAAALFTAMVCVCGCVCSRVCVCSCVSQCDGPSRSGRRERLSARARVCVCARARARRRQRGLWRPRERLPRVNISTTTCTTLRVKAVRSLYGNNRNLGGSHLSHSRNIKSVYFAFRTALS